ncbi:MULTISPECIES: hypothetical protein [Paenibacillus]|uniref:hypothetical protein n=1 Tax=Paenibacillus TaxID=44249 RepID=UPI0022B92EFD|nr:hypothetical protein [Paenibacillus caseinilyticus]MCZ8521833.1 hypothetical protein [Paenibacillus caseinilyticus]
MEQRPAWYKRMEKEPFYRKTFTLKNIQNVESELRKGRSLKKSRRLLGSSGVLIAAAVAALFFYFTNPKSEEQLTSLDTVASVIDTTSSNAIVHQKIEVEHVSIFDKMLNSMDYFKTVHGSYIVKDIRSNVEHIVECWIDEGQTPSSYVSTKGTSPMSKSLIVINDGEYRMQIVPDKDGQISYSKEKINFENMNKSEARFYKENGNAYWEKRGDLAGAEHAEMIFPQTFAFWMVNPISMEPEYQETEHIKMLDRDVTVLEGKLSLNIKEKQGASHFKYWVDTATGVMMKMILSDEKNAPVYEMNMVSITYDKNIERSTFSTEPQNSWKESKQIVRSAPTP